MQILCRTRRNYKMLIPLHLCWIVRVVSTDKTVGIARDRKIFPARKAHGLRRSCGKRDNCEQTFMLRAGTRRPCSRVSADDSSLVLPQQLVANPAPPNFSRGQR